jgi:hypothetical protein
VQRTERHWAAGCGSRSHDQKDHRGRPKRRAQCDTVAGCRADWPEKAKKRNSWIKGEAPSFTAWLLLEIDVGERLPAGVADDETGVRLLDGPGRGKRRGSGMASDGHASWRGGSARAGPSLPVCGAPRGVLTSVPAAPLRRPLVRPWCRSSFVNSNMKKGGRDPWPPSLFPEKARQSSGRHTLDCEDAKVSILLADLLLNVAAAAVPPALHGISRPSSYQICRAS